MDYFGAPTPVKQMGSISVPDSQTLMITPFDKSSLRDIERAIQESDIGINPNNDGERIRLIMPPMTQVRLRGRLPYRTPACGRILKSKTMFGFVWCVSEDGERTHLSPRTVEGPWAGA